MTGAAFAVLWAHWWRHPVQLLALIGGLAMATALFSGVQAINSEARAAYSEANSALNLSAQGQIVATDAQAVALSDYVALRRAGWPVAPLREGTLRDDGRTVRILGIDPLNPPTQLGLAGEDGDFDLPGFLSGQFALAEAGTQSRWQGRAGLPQLVAHPIGEDDLIIADISLAQRLLDGNGDLSRLVLLAPPPQGQSLTEITPGLRFAGTSQPTDPAELTESFHLNLTAFGLLSFAVGLFIVQAVVNLAFAQRRASLATLRLLGLPLSRLMVLLALEQIGLAVIAGLLGVFAGYLLAAALMPDIAATLSGLYGADISGTLHFRPQWWAMALGMAVLGSLLASLNMFIQLPKTHVLAAPNLGRIGAVRRMSGHLAMAGAAALLAAGLLWLFGSGLIAGFGVLACLLAGGALGLPWLLAKIAAWAERQRQGPIWTWFWADMQLQLSGVSLALMALLLALATTIGVATMVASFRLTFEAFLDQRLTADLYVELHEPSQIDTLTQIDGAQIYPVRQGDWTVEGLPIGVIGTELPPQAQAAWRFLDAQPEVWGALNRAQGVMISEQLARQTDLALGDDIRLAPGLRVSVLAIYADYGNPRGQMRMGEAMFLQLFPDPPLRGASIYTADAAAFRQRLVDQHGIAPSQITDQSAAKSTALGIFERTFAVTAALSVLTLAVAGFAMLMALLTMAGMRAPHLAPLWAMGVSRAQLGLVELARMLGLALMTALLAVPLGLAQAMILLRWINVEAFGWQLPLFLFPGQYAQMVALALLTALLAALWPALRLMRSPPAALIKVFSHAD